MTGRAIPTISLTQPIAQVYSKARLKKLGQEGPSMHLIPGSRAPFSIELVSLAILLVLPCMLWSFYLVRAKKQYQSHKKIQIFLSIAILAVLVIFEVEIRLYGWRQYAEASPYIDRGLIPFLVFHVTIASIATVLWTWALVHALKNVSTPPKPGTYSEKHKKLGKAAGIFMLLTSITGWTFFILAFCL